ncbi:hypothetical protein D3C73_859970 [compost metagenome]
MQVARVLRKHFVKAFLGFGKTAHVEIGKSQIVMRRQKIGDVLYNFFQQRDRLRKLPFLEQAAGSVMLHYTLPAADPDQRSRTVQLILQQLHQFFGLGYELSVRILLKIGDQTALGLFKAFHICIVISHIEVAFRHRGINFLQNMG